MVKIAAVVALVSLALGGAGAWKLQEWRYEARLAEAERDRASEAIAAANELTERVNTAREEERARFVKVQEAEREARKREQVQRAAAAAARAESDRLRDDLGALKSGLPGLTERAVRVYADSVSGLLGECAARYQSVADSAQGHAGDVILLLESWPKEVEL